MSPVWHLILFLGVCRACATVLRGHSVLRETTVITAWKWGVVAMLCWTLVWFCDCCAGMLSPAAADHAWYICAVLALCPPIGVLGSRRPGNRAWTQFILFPMLLALSWPLVALRLQGSELRELQLETPPLVGFILVLVMGVGNYCGTRHTFSALIYGAATAAIGLTCSRVAPGWFPDRATARELSTAGMALSISLLSGSAQPVGAFAQPVGATRFDRLWFDFFDTFGIVWGRRIQDRVNFVAQKEGWPVRLEPEGFVVVDSPPSGKTTSIEMSNSGCGNVKAEIDSRIERMLRWLLRRFVNPKWIDERIGLECSANTTQKSEIRVDS